MAEWEGQPMSTRICIYCLEEKDAADFNREHVVPRSFGMFEGNLVLHCACADCNSYFGNKLDFALARDSYEAVLRLKHGLKPAREVQDLGGERTTFRLSVPGAWNGVRMELRQEGDEVVCVPAPQVGLKRIGSPRWEYFTASELAGCPRRVSSPPIAPGGIRIIANAKPVEENLIALLAAGGVVFHKEGNLSPYPCQPGDIVDLDHYFHIDSIVQRSIAKIAFNYMAFATDAAFARHPDFGAIRSFIRYGTPVSYPVVEVKDGPILYHDSITLRQTEGHLVTLNWSPYGRGIVGQVCLFNDVAYRVYLSPSFSGVWRSIRSGHHFDVSSRKISPLVGI